VARRVLDKREGRNLFGEDAAGYDAARPGHPARVYELLVERCGLGPGTAVLEVGPGTGQATRRLLELGADPLVAVEPDPALAEFLLRATGGRPRIVASPLEDAELEPGAFDLATAASCFHWVDEPVGLAKIAGALRTDGWWAMWWTLFGEPGVKDEFMEAVDHLFADLPRSPTGARESGRPSFALDVDARLTALTQAGFRDLDHHLIPWPFEWDASGIRGLYSSFSPIRSLDAERREALLDEVARIAERDFGGRIGRRLTTSLYLARKPV
jgi:SAM-dependent methyltransferase